MTVKEAQRFVKNFAKRNRWEDFPNVDKFDHLHEELIEMSKYLRYHSRIENEEVIQEHKEVFLDGIGDLFFGVCRLANQLNIDIETAFNFVRRSIVKKYMNQSEVKLVKKQGVE